MEKTKLVIVGNGMVGQRLVDELITLRAHDRWDIVVLGEEPRLAYDRVALSSWFGGATEDQLSLVDVDAVAEAGIAYRPGCRVSGIDRVARKLELEGGEMMAYEHLVLATGSTPFVPPIPGHDSAGCFVYRTIDDLEGIAARAAEPGCTVGTVIGGGLLGLEAAHALVQLGLETHVVEMAPHLMPQQLGADAADMLRRHIDALGVKLHLGTGTTEIVTGERGVAGLRFTDETSQRTELLVISAGIRPADALARAAGLECGERGGVVVDAQMRTSDPAISAVGEVACHHGRTYGLVGPGYAMAKIVAQRLVGARARDLGVPDMSTKLKLLGVDVASFGVTDPTAEPGLERIVHRDPLARIHRELLVDAEGRVRGGLLVGDASGYQLLRMMAADEMATPAEVVSLVLPDGLAGVDLGAMDLGDSAGVCSCNGISAGEIRSAVTSGCRTAAEVGAATGAGTSCAGCVPAVSSLVLVTLEASGIAVDRSLCEHFAHSRQELFDLIRFHRHHSWSAVVAAHGTGRGCSTCRPVVASILASLDSEHILDGDLAGLQDTNDRSLANMQRNGTYSVVPRVPGGEITPAQLIALGEIAQDYGLYTKVTGGQRIDLFGATLNQLPSIWQRVIDAGMESGHAYGKALRTVKSCVGETWCRYGVQDSVAMAIRIELRYRGLRAPHKIKSAVSGCTRECAEAQSKDFGVIATENGWNLYVGGNGGRTPRHADLLATDLDDDMLIRLVDRFLMFYVRTADRLERSSVWLGNLDGGVEYLRSVIIDDSLGICEELEDDMARHVSSYQCEWTAALADPGRLEHFVEFVNAPDETSTPTWISERGQRVPAAVGRS